MMEERSPLAAALPFRHAKSDAPATMAIPMPTPEDLRRLAGGGPDPSAALARPLGAPSPTDQARAARAKLEQASTVAFAMPPLPATPAAGPPPPQPPHSPSPPHGASLPTGPLPPPPGASPVPAGGGPVAAKSTGHFGLSIEQYAALCAEIAVFPDRGEAIFAQYGLGARKDRMTADLAWQDKLRADHALMARWQGLYLHYHDHYSRLKGR